MSKTKPRIPEVSPQDQRSPSTVGAGAPPSLVNLEALLVDLNARLVTAGSVPLPRSQSPAAAPAEIMRIVIFLLNEVRYAVDIRYVNEVARRSDMTRVPGLPTWVLGVLNLHGEIVSVVDLPAFLKLNIPAARRTPDMLIVAQTADQKIGLMVDGVELIYAFPTDQVFSLPLRGEPELVPYLRGAVEREGQLIRLLDGERLLLGPNMQQFA